MMRSEGFEQLRQRVLAAYHLQPLTEEETRQYIEHRLKLVGWNGDPYIDDDVYARLYEFTGGVPRKTNLLCDRVLLYGCLEELHHINRAVIDNVLEDVKQELWSPEPGTGQGVESDYEPTMLKSSASPRRISADSDEVGGEVASEGVGEPTVGGGSETNLRSVIHELRQELKKFKDEVKQIKGRTDVE